VNFIKVEGNKVQMGELIQKW